MEVGRKPEGKGCFALSPLAGAHTEASGGSAARTSRVTTEATAVSDGDASSGNTSSRTACCGSAPPGKSSYLRHAIAGGQGRAGQGREK
eukprot:359619-Chlamydomonas_euryale.AAC.7